MHVDWFVLVVLAGWLVCKEGNNIGGGEIYCHQG